MLGQSGMGRTPSNITRSESHQGRMLITQCSNAFEVCTKFEQFMHFCSIHPLQVYNSLRRRRDGSKPALSICDAISGFPDASMRMVNGVDRGNRCAETRTQDQGDFRPSCALRKIATYQQLRMNICYRDSKRQLTATSIARSSDHQPATIATASPTLKMSPPTAMTSTCNKGRASRCATTSSLCAATAANGTTASTTINPLMTTMTRRKTSRRRSPTRTLERTDRCRSMLCFEAQHLETAIYIPFATS